MVKDGLSNKFESDLRSAITIALHEHTMSCLRQYGEMLLAQEQARGILPAEQALLDRMPS